MIGIAELNVFINKIEQLEKQQREIVEKYENKINQLEKIIENQNIEQTLKINELNNKISTLTKQTLKKGKKIEEMQNTIDTKVSQKELDIAVYEINTHRARIYKDLTDYTDEELYLYHTNLNYDARSNLCKIVDNTYDPINDKCYYIERGGKGQQLEQVCIENACGPWKKIRHNGKFYYHRAMHIHKPYHEKEIMVKNPIFDALTGICEGSFDPITFEFHFTKEYRQYIV
jgi:chaperonin cofactor prefoldin